VLLSWMTKRSDDDFCFVPVAVAVDGVAVIAVAYFDVVIVVVVVAASIIGNGSLLLLLLPPVISLQLFRFRH